MKLGKVLAVSLILGVMSSNVLAVEVTNDEAQVAVSENEESASVSGEVSTNDIAMFDEKEVDYLQKYGEAVGASTEKGNIRITVENILSDAYTYKMLLSVQTIDGTALKGDEDYIELGAIHVKDKKRMEIEDKKKKLVEALPENAGLLAYLKIQAQFDEKFNERLTKYIREDGTFDQEGFYNEEDNTVNYNSAGGGYGLAHTAKNTANKKYFICTESRSEAAGNEVVAQIEKVTEQEENVYDITQMILDYLKIHENDQLATMPLKLMDEEKEALEEIKLTNEEWYKERKEELAKRPKEILPDGKLKLSVAPDNQYNITNMGFINNQFHIRFNGKTKQHYNLDVSSKDKDWVMDIYNDYCVKRENEEDEEQQIESYRVYDIKDIEALKNYSFKVMTYNVVEEVAGPFEIPFTLKPFAEPKIIKVNKYLSYNGDKKMLLKTICLNAYSVNLSFGEVPEKLHLGEIQVKLKDGTIKEVGSNATYGENTEKTWVYRLNNIKGEDVKSILYKGQEILL